jgi:hypothetical protein
MPGLARAALLLVAALLLTATATSPVDPGQAERVSERVSEGVRDGRWRRAALLAHSALQRVWQRYECESATGRAFVMMQSSLGEQAYERVRERLSSKMLGEGEGEGGRSYLMVSE